MTRTVTVAVPVDTSLFTPLQAQPNALLSLGMSGWARWLHEHWVSFPRLVGELGLGVVIAGFDLEYTRPLSFFDSEALVATAAMRVRDDGGLFFLDVTFAADDATPFARGGCVLRPVKIGEGVALSAVPKNVGREILARFAKDEIVPRAAAARTLPHAS